ncbi:MAG: hypothetical protein HQK53_05440, partial [Oligoflexia bacterium]|nr:hypothetical protein [Oligoflexia bacterium]
MIEKMGGTGATGGTAGITGVRPPTQSAMKNLTKEEMLSYLKVARAMESEFVKFLLSEMRKTVFKESPDSSEAEFYTSML